MLLAHKPVMLELCSATARAGQLTAGESFWVGGLARTLAAVATCPVTVVKTQMEYAGYSVKHQVSSPCNAPGLCPAQLLNQQ